MSAAGVIAIVVTGLVVATALGLFVWAAWQDGREQRREDALRGRDRRWRRLR
jgi:hypothetical protein